MHGKGRFSDVPFFETVQEILSHYSCPSTCPAICCKIADINLDEKDMRILRQASKDEADRIESYNEDEEPLYKMHPPCPFLRSDRCGVYGMRPTMCRLFPFNISTMPDALLLFPCDMAASMFKDYVEYYNMLKNPVHAKTIDAFKQSHRSFAIRLNEGLPIQMLVIKIDELLPFKEYLGSRRVHSCSDNIPL
ncbi:MAG: YkgJ family cysteine cluster protein [Methanolobus sp.]|uniref:YkgJ family cysteine cluster protein n=1 Tax=Methanolobus sp. TaxID=1874737 RepID=UPI00272FE900|nr:YkgJ family cysteine cluster protein [Methanolobus sp.]MDP2215877.1 YkgJ family cysteine cluster protein [Methanolobus sp.]